MAAHRKLDQRRDDLCAGGLRRGAVSLVIAPPGQRFAASPWVRRHGRVITGTRGANESVRRAVEVILCSVRHLYLSADEWAGIGGS
jgi:hypothetical protein